MITLDENGLTISTQAELRDELVAKLRDKFGANLDVDPTSSIMGQIVEELTELRAVDHQTMLAIHRSMDPNNAQGRVLDARVGLTGTTRKGATHSFVNGTLSWSGSGVMNNGDLIKNDDTGELWELTDGPHSSPGAGYTVAAQFQAVETGPKIAEAGTTWSLVTIVSGLDSFTNPSDDATKGRDREADGPLRTRRLVELHSQGQGPLAAIQGVVSKVDGVEYVRVYHNPDTSPADSDGIPFKAFNVVVETQPSTPGATLQRNIWTAIWGAVGAGGEAYGTDFSGTVVDSEGTDQPVSFDTVTIVDVNIEVDLITSGTEDPITPNIATVVADRILEVATDVDDGLEKHGRDVRRIDIQGIVYDMLSAGDISGPYAVNVRMSLDADPLADVDRVVIGIREKPDFDSVNIAVLVDG